MPVPLIDTQFLGIPGINGWMFHGLALVSFATSFIGVVTGAGGGLVLLSIMALIFPPAVLVPMHTVVQLGVGSSRAVLMWRYVLRGTLLPFLIGSAVGAAAGAQIFIALPTAILQGAMGLFILVLAWLPKLARSGAEGRRFVLLGFVATFLGMFVSATGTLVAPFVASASPDRRNHVATVAVLMATGHITKLVAFGLLGVTLAPYAPLMLAMIVTAALGSWVGSRVLDRMPERLFRIILQALLTVLGLRLVWVGATGSGLL